MFSFSACANPKADQPLIASLEKLANSGNAEALYYLGMSWHTGSGVARDYTKAFDAFHRSAALGDVLASYKLGCYYAGQGEGVVQPNQQAALDHKLVAAKAGYALAEQDVAAIYAARGETADALVWLRKAADQGWPDALMMMASIYNGFPGVERDSVKTSAYFHLFIARTGGTAEQQEWLSKFDEKLSVVERREARAVVQAYMPRPTALTVRALSGQRAAEDLVAGRS
jgi:TPR repeat protein